MLQLKKHVMTGCIQAQQRDMHCIWTVTMWRQGLQPACHYQHTHTPDICMSRLVQCYSKYAHAYVMSGCISLDHDCMLSAELHAQAVMAIGIRTGYNRTHDACHAGHRGGQMQEHTDRLVGRTTMQHHSVIAKNSSAPAAAGAASESLRCL